MWINNSITPPISQSVVFIDNARDMWNGLKDILMRGNQIKVAQLHKEILNLKQGNKKDSNYFTELRNLWKELEQYRPIPKYTYCVTIRNAKSLRSEDRIIQFLIGLNEEYQGVASQVLLMDPLPQINKVFSLVM